MADRVVIAGVKRAGNYVEKKEIRQMAGRAGRSADRGAFVDVVASDDEYKFVESCFSNDTEMNVESVFTTTSDVSFELLADIHRGYVQSKEDAERWFDRSFACFQGMKVDMKSLVSYLLGHGAIIETDGRLKTTEMGRMCSEMYFRAEDAVAWKNNWNQLIDIDRLYDDHAVSWAMCNIPSNKDGISFNDKQVIGNYKSTIAMLGLFTGPSMIPSGIAWYCALTGKKTKGINYAVGQLKADFNRISTVLRFWNRYNEWGLGDYFEDLSVRIRNSVPLECVHWIREGLAKRQALLLENLGVKEWEDVLQWEDEIRYEGGESDWERIENRYKAVVGKE